MVQNALTRGQIRLKMSRLLEAETFHPMTPGATATGGSTTTLVDSAIAAGIYQDSHFTNYELVNQTKAFRTFITNFTQSSGTFTFPVNTASVSGDTFEVHNRAAWLSGQYDDAIDLAIEAAAHADAFTDVCDQTLCFRYDTYLYTLPSSTFSAINKVSVDTRQRLIARHQPVYWDNYTALRDASARTKIAQSFQVIDGDPGFVLGDVYLLLAGVGTLTGNISVTIEADSAGAPSGTALATSANVTASTLSAAPAYQRFTFTARPRLAKNTTYWIVLQGTFTIDATNYVNWANDTDAGYSNGSAAQYSGAVWSAVTGDFVFSIRPLQPRLMPLKWKTHWDVKNDTTRSLYVTDAGNEFLRTNALDGAPLYVEGQARPTLPTLDTDTVNVPFDWVVAHAGLTLLALNGDWKTDARGLIPVWQTRLQMVEPQLRTPLKSGSVPVEAN